MALAALMDCRIVIVALAVIAGLTLSSRTSTCDVRSLQVSVPLA